MKKNFILFLLVAFFSAALFTGCDIFNVDVKVTVKTGNIAVINGTGFYLESVKYRKVGDTSYSENKILTSVLKLSPNEELLI
ncbi:MAG TPA: hypothetical protein PK771_14975, partial [Spirochaetota bacterium]|nr:hypothetical protein [Spirochaetota bacterium]